MQSIDPELKYCPICRDEYRADFSLCAICNQELVNGRDLISQEKPGDDKEIARTVAITEEDSLIPLQRGSLQDMKNLQRLLEKAAVPTMLLKDEDNSGKGCCGTEVFVHIREQDIKRASEVIRAEHEVTTVAADYDLSTADAVFDPGAALTSCPACGCHFMPTSNSCPDCGLQFA